MKLEICKKRGTRLDRGMHMFVSDVKYGWAETGDGLGNDGFVEWEAGS